MALKRKKGVFTGKLSTKLSTQKGRSQAGPFEGLPFSFAPDER